MSVYINNSEYNDLLFAEEPSLHHLPMDIPHRAKQFAPFAALKGYEEAVHQKQILYEARPEPSEDAKEELDFQLRMLRYGSHLKILWFDEKGAPEGRGVVCCVEGHFDHLTSSELFFTDSPPVSLSNMISLQTD